MSKYRIKPGCGSHSRRERGAKVTYQPGGAAFTPSQQELAAIGDKLEKVEEPRPKAGTKKRSKSYLGVPNG